jgi:hypothetical protein
MFDRITVVEEPSMYTECTCPPNPETYIWLPTLGDLLDELERRGYDWQFWNVRKDGLDSIAGCPAIDRNDVDSPDADTRADAAGLALEWVMEQEKEAQQ